QARRCGFGALARRSPREVARLILLPERPLEQETLQGEGTVDDDLFAFAKPRDDFHIIERRSTENEVVELEVVIGMVHKSERLAADFGDGIARDDERRRTAIARVDADVRGTEETEAQPIVAVLELDSRRHGSGDGIDLFADVGNGTFEAVLRIRVELHVGV